MALIVLLAIVVTVGRLTPFMVLVPVVALPVRLTFKPLVVTDPDPELLVKDRLTRLSLLELVVKESASLPLLKVKLPEVMTSLPEVKVRFLPDAMVVSPPMVTSPVEVLNVPVDPEASKLPEVCE